MSCKINLWDSLLDYVFHQFAISCGNDWWLHLIPTSPAKLVHTVLANGPLFIMWLMLSSPLLFLQQKQLTVSILKVISLSLVGSLLFKILDNKKEMLKGTHLFQICDWYWFLFLFSRISFMFEAQVKFLTALRV